MINWNLFLITQLLVGFTFTILSKSEILYYEDARVSCYKGLINHRFSTKLVSLSKMEYYYYSPLLIIKCNNFWNRCGYDNFVFGPYVIKNAEEFILKLYTNGEAIVYESNFANDNWFITSLADVGELKPVINFFEKEGFK